MNSRLSGKHHVLALAAAVAFAPAPEPIAAAVPAPGLHAPPDRPPVVLQLALTGQVNVNGTAVSVSGTGTFDTVTGAYQLQNVAPSGGPIPVKDKLLMALIPRATLAFLSENGGQSLLDQSPTSSIQGQLGCRRKIDGNTTVTASYDLSISGVNVTINYTGSITTGADRPIVSDGESVIRLGMNPNDQSFIGGARVNYDTTAPDPMSLGTADFWNLSGSFTGVQLPATQSFGHVDQGGGNPATGLAQGTLLLFQTTTVFQPAVITLSGTATQPMQIKQFFGIANQTGGGLTHIDVVVPIPAGTTAVQAAGLIESTMNTQATTLGVPLLAVQGGDGTTTTSNPSSPSVAFAMSLNGTTIAQPQDPAAAALFVSPATQAFPDWAVEALFNSGLRNQFGVVGNPALPGWLTPFKIEINADNPNTNNLAAGGDVRVLLNWCDRLPGGNCVPGTTTSFPDLVIPTNPGESSDTVAARAVVALKTLVTPWNTQPLTQRIGNRIYVDAGVEFPHSVSVQSNDAGLGYMSAAADLPCFAVSPIPTLGEWGLIVLAALLLGYGWYVVAQRRRVEATPAT